MLLISIFVELRVVAGRSRTRAGSPQAVGCRGLEKNGMVRAWHGRGMASVNQTRPHCVNQMGKTHSKPLTARHGRGTAWARHAMCESALTSQMNQVYKLSPTLISILILFLHLRACLRSDQFPSLLKEVVNMCQFLLCVLNA